LEAAPVKDARYRSFVRHMFAHTEELSCDNQGRLVLPPVLRSWAHIEKDVTSIGSLTRVEVWAKDRYVSVAASAGDLTDYRSELGLY
jgi:MraZ protein